MTRDGGPMVSDGWRVLVTGSRTWTDSRIIRAEIGLVVLERIAGTGNPYPRVVIVHGAAQGADGLAAAAADDFRLRQEPHRADWRKHGRRAGVIRNAEMVRLGADLCLAFIRDGSPGATHCAALAEKAGIPVRRFLDPDPHAGHDTCPHCGRCRDCGGQHKTGCPSR